jgi:ankyrin repeat protein
MGSSRQKIATIWSYFVNVLFKKGAAINVKGASRKFSLQIATPERHLPVVKLLLNRDAQIDQTSQLHGTALSAAASHGRVVVVRFLLYEKSNVNVVGGPYGNALQAAEWIWEFCHS